MDIEMLKEFIKPELLILIPVLYFIATAIKNTLLIKDKYIPLVLGLLGIVLAVIYIFATEEIAGTQAIFKAIFTAITQGVLCAGASVYVNQLIKQTAKEE
jgi:uncharacterized membrane protein